MPLPDLNAYGSSWYAATAVASPPRPPLTAETDVDVCVIGAGLAGLTVAREVARRGWSVVVLESRSVAWNASGRNTGFVLPGFAADAQALVTRVGVDHARKLWALSEAGVDYVRNAIAETAMPGVDATEGGWLRVSKTGRRGAMQAEADLLVGALGATVEVWPAARVREQLRSPLYFDAIHHPRAFSIHPLNYALGLAAAAEASGARIHEGTSALQIDPIGVRKRIVTKDARVRAGYVVLAGNVHLAELLPQFAATLLPVHRYVIVTAPLGRALREFVRHPGPVSDSDFADGHYRVVDGERLLWSGHNTAWLGMPHRHAEALLGEIARTYPWLSAQAEYAWAGTLAGTVHGMPQIGEISQGLWLMTGFGDHGLNTTAMAGELIARAILDGDRTLQLFEPFEMVWAGGGLGRAAQQIYYWSARAGERIKGELARWRRGPEPPEMRAALQPMEFSPEPPPLEPPIEEALPEQALPLEPAAAEPVAAEPAAPAETEVVEPAAGEPDRSAARLAELPTEPAPAPPAGAALSDLPAAELPDARDAEARPVAPAATSSPDSVAVFSTRRRRPRKRRPSRAVESPAPAETDPEPRPQEPSEG